jgi:hypothetical protein
MAADEAIVAIALLFIFTTPSSVVLYLSPELRFIPHLLLLARTVKKVRDYSRIFSY